MDPPRHTADANIRRKTSAAHTADLINAAGRTLEAFAIDISRSKVSRLVRRYEYQVARNGISFADYFTNQIALKAGQRRTAFATELGRVIAYADPTGETAVSNVHKQRGY